MYYPKSQIQTNLYSNGDLMVLSTKEAYTGYYWTTSGGRSYSGRTPSSKGGGLELGRTVNEGLFAPLNEPGAQSSTSYIAASTDTLKYTELIGDNFTRNSRVPTYSPPKPTNKDYQTGAFTRFLCKKINESLFIEISSDEYIKLINKDKNLLFKLYKPFKLNWVITGDTFSVINENRIEVEYLENTEGFIGLGNYLKFNYSQLYGLFTNGGEYLLPNGKDYVGLYHIHPDKGPMVGRIHTSTPHSSLTPIGQTPSNPSQPAPSSPNIYNGPTNNGSGY
jgi:hypothetical protein